MNFSQSRHEKWLETQYEQLKTFLVNSIAKCDAQRETDLLAQEYTFRTYIADLKKAHAEELKRVIEENASLRDLCERYRVALTPSIEKRPEGTDNTPLPSPGEQLGGLPFERVLRRYAAEEAVRLAVKHTKPADAPIPNVAIPQGETHAS